MEEIANSLSKGDWGLVIMGVFLAIVVYSFITGYRMGRNKSKRINAQDAESLDNSRLTESIAEIMEKNFDGEVTFISEKGFEFKNSDNPDAKKVLVAISVE